MPDHIEQAALLIAHPKMTRPAKLHPDCPVCQNAMATVRQLADAGLLADPAQTTDAAAETTLPVDPGERALAWCRQWMATRETVHKRTAERDALQARLDAVRAVFDREWPADEGHHDFVNQQVEDARAALQGGQPEVPGG